MPLSNLMNVMVAAGFSLRCQKTQAKACGYQIYIFTSIIPELSVFVTLDLKI